jgi:hypothetical protein
MANLLTGWRPGLRLTYERQSAALAALGDSETEER